MSTVRHDIKPMDFKGLNFNYDKKKSKVFQPSVFSNLLVHLTPNNSKSGQCIYFESDISLLKMQNELSERNPELVEDFFKSASMNSSQKDVLADLKGDLTDGELLQFIKPRRIQSPAELKMWTDELMVYAKDIADKKEAAFKAELERIKAEKKEDKLKLDTAPKQVDTPPSQPNV